MDNNNREKIIGDYISSNTQLGRIFCQDERVFVARYLSDFANGLFGWYPFEEQCNILQVGSCFGAFSEILCQEDRMLDILESDNYRAEKTSIRMKGIENAHIINCDLEEYVNISKNKYDYVVLAVDEYHDVIHDEIEYEHNIAECYKLLKKEGTLLMCIPNRLAWKRICGVPDNITGIPFDGITENDSGLCRLDRGSLIEIINRISIGQYKIYYPFSDLGFVQMVYTDEFRPGNEMKERLFLCHEYKDMRVLDEWRFLDLLIKNDMILQMCDSFIVEVSKNRCSDIVYAALSSERSRKNAFATVVYRNKVIKRPLYPEGMESVDTIIENGKWLRSCGISVVDMKKQKNGIEMPYVTEPTLAQYIKEIIRDKKNDYIKIIDDIYKQILNSSEQVNDELNVMLWHNANADWGPILKKAYIEMIPVNCFWHNDSYLFFDQEYTKENTPAKFVLYRTIRDIYAFSPEAENIISLDDIKERYDLKELWDYFQDEENKFQRQLRQRDIYKGFIWWGYALIDTMKKNRAFLAEAPFYRNVFDIFGSLDNRRIILFGTGRYAEYYLMNNGKRNIYFVVDNDIKKQGRKWQGISVKEPETLTKLMPGTFRVVIAIKCYQPIVKQLEKLGIQKDDYRIMSFHNGDDN